MWVDLGIWSSFVWEDVFDGSQGEHDQGEGGAGGVEPISPVRAIHLSRLRFVRAYRARVVWRGAVQARRVASVSGRGRPDRLRLGARNELLVTDWVVADGQLEHPVEDQTAAV